MYPRCPAEHTAGKVQDIICGHAIVGIEHFLDLGYLAAQQLAAANGHHAVSCILQPHQ